MPTVFVNRFEIKIAEAFVKLIVSEQTIENNVETISEQASFLIGWEALFQLRNSIDQIQAKQSTKQ